MKLFYCWILLFVVCFACSSGDTTLYQDIQKEEKLIAELPPQVNRSNQLKAEFTSDYEGEIGTLKVVMTLVKVGKTLTGKYLMEGSDLYLDLSGTVQHNGEFVMYQLDKNGLKKAQFLGNLTTKEAIGFWSKTESDQQKPFVLKRVK
jgi:hypothetical protein